MTGNETSAAHIPGRCAAFPAPAIITLKPFSFAFFAQSKKISGSLCADIMVISKSIPIFFKKSAACAIIGISESLPITIPTFDITFLLCIDLCYSDIFRINQQFSPWPHSIPQVPLEQTFHRQQWQSLFHLHKWHGYPPIHHMES